MDSVEISGFGEVYIPELVEIVTNHVERQLRFIPDFRITGLYLVGSRLTGTSREDSDLDIVVEYVGSIKESRLPDVLNSNRLYFEALEIDLIGVEQFIPEAPYVKLM